LRKGAAINAFVLDASVTVAWCVEDERTKFSEGVLDLLAQGAQALAPTIWPLEIANALLTAERRKRISLARITTLLQTIAALPISVMPSDAKFVFEQMLPSARQHGLALYDAAYLQLAMQHGLPLATIDERLRRSARVAGVELVSV
jgi:predicted nucleic acid-binding protein